MVFASLLLLFNEKLLYSIIGYEYLKFAAFDDEKSSTRCFFRNVWKILEIFLPCQMPEKSSFMNRLAKKVIFF